MAKKRKKTQSKYLHAAARLRKDRTKKLAVMAVSLAVALVVLGVYYVLTFQLGVITLGEITSYLVWLFFAIVAAIVGWYGNRYSKASTEYKKYLREFDIEDDEVKKFAQSHRY